MKNLINLALAGTLCFSACNFSKDLSSGHSNEKNKIERISDTTDLPKDYWEELPTGFYKSKLHDQRVFVVVSKGDFMSTRSNNYSKAYQMMFLIKQAQLYANNDLVRFSNKILDKDKHDYFIQAPQNPVVKLMAAREGKTKFVALYYGVGVRFNGDKFNKKLEKRTQKTINPQAFYMNQNK